MTVGELREVLRSIPPIQPDPKWKRRAKRRLLRLVGDRTVDWRLMTRWAVYATGTEDTLPVFAANVRAAGKDWRPLVVEPQRLGATIRALQPSAIVLDASLAQLPHLVTEARASSSVEPLVLYAAELAELPRKIA